VKWHLVSKAGLDRFSVDIFTTTKTKMEIKKRLETVILVRTYKIYIVYTKFTHTHTHTHKRHLNSYLF
jgi:hypothetical protein